MPKKNKLLTANEFNDILDLLDEEHIEYIINVSKTTIYLHTKACDFHCSLTEKPDDAATPDKVGSSLAKRAPFHHLKVGEYGKYIDSFDKVHWDFKVACGYSYYNEEHVLKPIPAFSYDVNSAFAYAMMQDMPDTTKEPKYDAEVGEHEIGFYRFGGCTTEVGAIADIVFPLMKSPFIDFVEHWYYIKKSTVGAEHEKAKYYLNIASGLVAKHNVFLRNAIIYYSNRYIKSFIDEDTLYVNVDSIISSKPRTDIPIGNELGQFKLEHNGDIFKYKQEGIYQWNNECHYKGITGKYITDIENTAGWVNRLPYRFNNETKRIIKNEQETQNN